VGRRFAKAGRFAGRSGEIDAADLAFVRGQLLRETPRAHIAKMAGLSVADIDRWANLLAVKAGEPAPPPIVIPRGGMGDILQEVASETGVSAADIMGRDRARAIANARQAFMWRCRAVLREDGGHRYSLPQIGAFLGGMDHTTVRHGVLAHEARLDTTSGSVAA
jgi:hypothetical protein